MFSPKTFPAARAISTRHSKCDRNSDALSAKLQWNCAWSTLPVCGNETATHPRIVQTFFYRIWQGGLWFHHWTTPIAVLPVKCRLAKVPANPWLCAQVAFSTLGWLKTWLVAQGCHAQTNWQGALSKSPWFMHNSGKPYKITIINTHTKDKEEALLFTGVIQPHCNNGNSLDKVLARLTGTDKSPEFL